MCDIGPCWPSDQARFKGPGATSENPCHPLQHLRCWKCRKCMKMSCLRGPSTGWSAVAVAAARTARPAGPGFQEPVMARSWVTSSTGLLLSQSPAIIEGSQGVKGQNEQRPNSCGNPAGAVWLLGDFNDSYFGILFTCWIFCTFCRGYFNSAATCTSCLSSGSCCVLIAIEPRKNRVDHAKQRNKQQCYCYSVTGSSLVWAVSSIVFPSLGGKQPYLQDALETLSLSLSLSPSRALDETYAIIAFCKIDWWLFMHIQYTRNIHMLHLVELQFHRFWT